MVWRYCFSFYKFLLLWRCLLNFLLIVKICFVSSVRIQLCNVDNTQDADQLRQNIQFVFKRTSPSTQIIQKSSLSNTPHFLSVSGLISYTGRWENTRKVCKPRDKSLWFANFSSVLPTSPVVRDAGKPIKLRFIAFMTSICEWSSEVRANDKFFLSFFLRWSRWSAWKPSESAGNWINYQPEKQRLKLMYHWMTKMVENPIRNCQANWFEIVIWCMQWPFAEIQAQAPLVSFSTLVLVF